MCIKFCEVFEKSIKMLNYEKYRYSPYILKCNVFNTNGGDVHLKTTPPLFLP